jgi:hypothetical protein
MVPIIAEVWFDLSISMQYIVLDESTSTKQACQFRKHLSVRPISSVNIKATKMLLTHTHLIAIISILGSIAKAQDGLDGPGIVVPTVAWTEFTFYSAKDANEAYVIMSHQQT